MNRRIIKGVTCRELGTMLGQRPLEIIDVRTPEEFREVHAAGARNFAIETLDPQTVITSRTPK